MEEDHVRLILKNDLKYNLESINKLNEYVNLLLIANRSHNFIAKSTEKDVWSRHILDSAQLVKFINFNSGSLADLGSGAGFPGIVLAIFNQNKKFHVKLYEKSIVKRKFLLSLMQKLDINVEILADIYEDKINVNYIVSRAFKKLDKILQVSREICLKTHRIIVLKGKNAEGEANKAFKNSEMSYKLINSITSKESKILIADVIK